MMKSLTEYDYEPGESLHYLTLIIYYQTLSQNDSAEIFFEYFAVLYCDCAHTSIHIIFSVYANPVVNSKQNLFVTI